MARVLLEQVMDSVVPSKKKRTAARKKTIVTAVQIGIGLLSVVVMRWKKFAPVQQAMSALLLPVGDDAAEEAKRVWGKIQRLKGELAGAGDDEAKQKLKAQLDVLFELLHDAE